LILGDDELAQNQITVKNMNSGDQKKIDLDTLIETIRKSQKYLT